MNKETFIAQTHLHKEDVIALLAYANDIITARSLKHDDDKLVFAAGLLDDQDALAAWIRDGFPIHAHTSLHHKENIEDMFGVVEMLVDWVAASYRRNGVLDPEQTRLPSLNWEKIMRNTLRILVERQIEYPVK